MQLSRWLRPAPVPAGNARLGKVNSPMPLRSGRLEKRIEVAIPLQISTLLDPETEERTTTENVCSLGIRVVTEHSRQLDERLMIRSLTSNLRRLARVVYCQRLSDGHFAVGLQFQGGAVKWSDDSTLPGTPLVVALANFFPRFVFWEPSAFALLNRGTPPRSR